MTGVLVQRDDQRQDCRAPSSSLHDSHLDSRMEQPRQLWGVWSANIPRLLGLLWPQGALKRLGIMILKINFFPIGINQENHTPYEWDPYLPTQSTPTPKPKPIPNTNSWAWKARFAHKLANVLIPWRFSWHHNSTSVPCFWGGLSGEKETSICCLWQIDDWSLTDRHGRIKSQIYLSDVQYFTNLEKPLKYGEKILHRSPFAVTLSDITTIHPKSDKKQHPQQIPLPQPTCPWLVVSTWVKLDHLPKLGQELKKNPGNHHQFVSDSKELGLHILQHPKGLDQFSIGPSASRCHRSRWNRSRDF